MSDVLLIILAFLVAIGAVLAFIFFSLNKKLLKSEPHFENLEKNQQRAESVLKDEISKTRSETSKNDQLARQELSTSLKSFSDSLLSRMTEIATLQKNQLSKESLKDFNEVDSS